MTASSTTLARRAQEHPGGVPDPEIPEKAKRRRFSAEYKLRLLRELDACSQPGQVGAILRREALYSSHVVEWRRARDAGALESLGKVRGRKPANPLAAENHRLRRENDRLTKKLSSAERVIEVQGKVSALLRELSLGSAENPNEK